MCRLCYIRDVSEPFDGCLACISNSVIPVVCVCVCECVRDHVCVYGVHVHEILCGPWESTSMFSCLSSEKFTDFIVSPVPLVSLAKFGT